MWVRFPPDLHNSSPSTKPARRIHVSPRNQTVISHNTSPPHPQKTLSRSLFWLIFLILLALWIWSRFSHLTESFHFFGDSGRDAWEMYKMATSHKPTLLGPSTSYLPLNLSPLYFYWLFPFFILTGQSFFYSQIALFVFTWLILALIAFFVYRQPTYRSSFLFLTFLFCLIVFIPRFKYLLTASLIIYWLVTAPPTQFFRSALQKVADFAHCMQQVCQTMGETPFYYALQSKHHPYHSDYSYAYGLSQAGCQVKLIATEPDSAQTLLIFEEDREFIFGEEDFYKLTLFDEATISARAQCSDDWRWLVLTQID